MGNEIMKGSVVYDTLGDSRGTDLLEVCQETGGLYSSEGLCCCVAECEGLVTPQFTYRIMKSKGWYRMVSEGRLHLRKWCVLFTCCFRLDMVPSGHELRRWLCHLLSIPYPDGRSFSLHVTPGQQSRHTTQRSLAIMFRGCCVQESH